MKAIRLCSIVLLGILASASSGQTPAKQPGKRTAWTTSRITGSPEPPPPYQIVRAFPKLSFKNPLLLTTAPGIKRFFVCEQAGKIFSFPLDPNVDKADLVLDLRAEREGWDKAKVRSVGDLYGLEIGRAHV